MRLFIPLLVSLLWLSGCTGVSVSSDYDQTQDFGSFESYAWLEPDVEVKTARIYNSPLFARRVRQAADKALQGRRLVRVESPGEAGLLVRYHLGLEQRMDVNTYGGGFFGFRNCLHCSGFMGGTEVVVNDYQQTVLAIDLLRAGDRELVWRGVAERRVSTFDEPAEYDRYITETVNAILKRLPPALGAPPPDGP